MLLADFKAHYMKYCCGDCQIIMFMIYGYLLHVPMLYLHNFMTWRYILTQKVKHSEIGDAGYKYGSYFKNRKIQSDVFVSHYFLSISTIISYNFSHFLVPDLSHK